MEPIKHSFDEGGVLFLEGDRNVPAFLLLAGKVRLSRNRGDKAQLITVLSAGDMVGSEFLLRSGPPGYTATAITPVTALIITGALYKDAMDGVPQWLSSWLNQRIHASDKIPERAPSGIRELYGISSLLYVFLRIADLGANDESLKGSLQQVVEELGKATPQFRSYLRSIVRSLSEVGLIDLNEVDPLSPYIQIPDQKLFLGFLDYLRVMADLPNGIYGDWLHLEPITLSPEAGKLLDGILTDPELAERMFEPERSMVHLDLLRLNSIFHRAHGSGNLDLNHPCLEELEQLGAFKRVVDNKTQSVFGNLRDVIRINILRDPKTNFEDIADYLCTICSAKDDEIDNGKLGFESA